MKLFEKIHEADAHTIADLMAYIDKLVGRKTSLARGRSKRPRRPSPTRRFSFFYFLFKSLLSTIFLIYKLCVQLICMEKVMHTTRSLQKNYAHKLLLEKKYTHKLFFK
jgi:hypothetical protein